MIASENQLVSGDSLYGPVGRPQRSVSPCLTSHDPLVNYRAVSFFEASKNSA
jgi:hypothetical protein